MLPKIDVPKYTLKLPSTGKKIEYRPFLVKEEKILLTAMETTEDDEVERAIRAATKHIIDNCTFGKINADVDMSFTCNNEVDGKECGEINSLKVMIDKVRVKFPEEDLTKVEVTEDIGIKFKYLTTGELGRYEQEKNNVTKLFKVIVDSIDYIYDAEKVYKGSETPKKELLEFIESLNDVVFEKINRFFNEKPMLNHVEKFTCKKCGYKHVIELEGLTSFFG